MKMFAFTLQRLLDVKEALERAAEERLAASMRRLEAARERLRELSARRQQVIREIEGLNGAQTHRHRLSVHLRYLERVQAQIAGQLQRIVEHELETEQLRQEMCAIMRERKTLEKLKEHERRQWLLEGRRKEQKETDEFAASGYLRQRGLEVAPGG